ncbi:hypothetical protein [Elstera litoralis]|uniref:hypothetical protein n=1 Tax=Elstera litoralis TaxID=552518 RepID=UPI000698A3F0|nr:hypothetical protein [Elstera litoralis]
MTSYPAGPYRLTLLPHQPYAVRYSAAAPALGFAFDGQTGRHAFDSDRLRPFRTRPNSFAYVPPGCAVQSRSPTGGEYLTITLADALPAPQTTDLSAPALRPWPCGFGKNCSRRAALIRWNWRRWPPNSSRAHGRR